MKVKFQRTIKYGDKGPDVEAVGRVLARLKYGMKWRWFILQPKRVKRRWGIRKQNALKKYKRKNNIRPVDGKYDRNTHKHLSKHFKTHDKILYESYKEDPNTIHWAKLLMAMRQLNNKTAGYSFGAGHGPPLRSMSAKDKFDCSSSTSKVLYDAGLFPSEYAWSSGDFYNYGVPGKGKYFTIYYNSGHVWIKLEKSFYNRFDTSPYSSSDSRRGPRLRFLPRLTSGFSSRHWPGM